MQLDIPANLKGRKLFKFLVENKAALIAQKKFEIKQADAISTYIEYVDKKGAGSKKAAMAGISSDATKLKARLIINTCNLFDSHSDVHITGLWGKSLSETMLLYLLQEHKMQFDKIISDDIIASAKTLSWKSLGAPYAGSTQCLVFDAIIDKKRNAFMFDQYLQGYVKNHSVGMRYIKMYLCISEVSPSWSAENDNWDKYYPSIINKEDVDEQGYFWAVTEAQLVEGSAVPLGSNWVTPTQSIEEQKSEPVRSTQKNKIEPVRSTRILDALKQLEKQIN